MVKSFTDFLINEEKKEYYILLKKYLLEEKKKYAVMPPSDDVFKAFYLTPLDKTKVVILGQDPYHEENQANGLAFSTASSTLPPSLKNIFKEIDDDFGITCLRCGDLSYLARQGVLLLNTILTVRLHKALSHKNIGWEVFTLNYIKMLNELDQPIVFLLFGDNAKKYEKYLTNDNHLVLSTSHPSPLSSYRGFFGSKVFSKCNEYLASKNIAPVIWNSADYQKGNINEREL